LDFAAVGVSLGTYRVAVAFEKTALGVCVSAQPRHSTIRYACLRDKITNPVGQIWSDAMMLKHIGYPEAGVAVVKAIETVLRERLHNPDLGGKASTEGGLCNRSGGLLSSWAASLRCSIRRVGLKRSRIEMRRQVLSYQHH
jgi:Isocitrate/isopropylmalate dehydrogenase